MSDQTSVVRRSAIHIPAGCKVEVGATTSALVDVGWVEGDVSAEHTWESFTLGGGNIKTVEEYIKNQAVDMTFNLCELYADNIASLSGGIITVENVAGTIVSGATQTVAAGYTYGKFIPITNQNGDGSAITINSVTQTGATTLVLDTDYFKLFNAQGVYGIYVIDTVTADNSKAFVIDYDYTPNASKKMYAGAESVTIVPKVIRFTDMNESTKKRQMTIFSSKIQSGFNFMFKGVEQSGVESLEIKLKGTIDSTLTSGKQLFEFIDEQSVS